MKNHAEIIRHAITIILAFSVIHYFFRSFYHLSLWEVVRWWTFNFFRVEKAGGYALGLFFGLLAYIATFYGFTNILYLGLFGEEQMLIYLGNSKQNTSVYYKQGDVRKTLLTGYDTEIDYNFSFENLLRPQIFQKDPGQESTVGTKKNRFTFLSVLAISCAMGSILLAALGVFHTFAFKVYETYPTSLPLADGEGALAALDSIIAHFHLTRGTYFLLIIVLLLCFIGFTMTNAYLGNEPKKRVEILPSSIRPDSVIQGDPVEIKPRLVRRSKPISSDSSRNEFEWVDSGDRYVNFRFSEGFTQPVYVTAIVHAEERDDMLGKVTENLRNGMPMSVKIGEHLNITICRERP